MRNIRRASARLQGILGKRCLGCPKEFGGGGAVAVPAAEEGTASLAAHVSEDHQVQSSLGCVGECWLAPASFLL